MPPTPNLPPSETTPPSGSKRFPRWLVALGALLALGLFVGVTIYLLQPGTPTARIRDVFLIFLALEVFLIGVALLVLIVQLAVLINLIQHEIRPVLDATQRTAQTLQGTARFLSDHLVEPVVKLNEYLAALTRLGGLLRGWGGKPKGKGKTKKGG